MAASGAGLEVTMRVLVTGGAGFIGSNLVDALASQGHEAGVIDDLSTGKRENLRPGVWLREVDILDTSLPALVAEFGPDAVVHLAAQASVPESLRDPQRDWAVNAEGTRIVAKAALAAGASRMLSASSAAVYGEPAEADLPLAETAPKAPVNPYGNSKLAAEGLLAEELSGTAVDWASFRFANVYGPRQDGLGEGGVVSVFCQRIHDGQAPVIFGDGTQTRDFIFVGDVVGAILSAIDAKGPLARGLGDEAAYNISTGHEASVDDLFAALQIPSGFLGEARYEPTREGDVMRSSLDPRKATEVFGWSAQSSLASGAELTWRWYASQP
jgi:UDP-glucose 4-epimerase